MGTFGNLNKFFKDQFDSEATKKMLQQMSGDIPTFCGKCGKIITKKLLYFSKKNPFGFNHTEKCRCGCNINYYNQPDKYHETEFYLRVFRSKYQEREKNYKKMVLKNGKTKYIKSS